MRIDKWNSGGNLENRTRSSAEPQSVPHHEKHHPKGTSIPADEGRPTSDGLILNQVQAALHGSLYEQLRNVRAYCEHGRITLQGRIPTYYLKQVAHELVRSVQNVRDIDNDLHVVCPR